jgi:hypothetical protein
MPNSYLQRRGDCYSFRIAVPFDLRTTINTRELVRALNTPVRRTAIPRALYLASKALTLFATLRAMPDDQRKKLRVDYSVIFDFNEDGSVQRIESEGDPHETDAINSIIRTGLEGASRRVQVDTPSPAPQSPAAVSVGISKRTLKGIIESFLADYRPLLPCNMETPIAITYHY